MTTGRHAAIRRADRVLGTAALMIALYAGGIAASEHVSFGGVQAAPAPVDWTVRAVAEIPNEETAAAELARERQCLAQAIYYEARGESRDGQIGVVEVILRRVRSDFYPDTICGVVFEGAERRTGCQFSFACNGAMRRPVDPATWEEARALSAQVLTGALALEGLTGDATHFHAAYVDPEWNGAMVKTTRIGKHIFYRSPRVDRGRVAPSS